MLWIQLTPPVRVFHIVTHSRDTLEGLRDFIASSRQEGAFEPSALQSVEAGDHLLQRIRSLEDENELLKAKVRSLDSAESDKNAFIYTSVRKQSLVHV